MKIIDPKYDYNESILFKKKDKSYSQIIVHCSDTDHPDNDNPQYIHDLHKNEKKWAGIGYHYFIDRSGQIFQGRDLRFIGSHCGGQNTKSIGICLSGKKFDYKDNIEQFKSLFKLINAISKSFKGIEIFPHNYFDSNKTCPNFDIQKAHDEVNSIKSES